MRDSRADLSPAMLEAAVELMGRSDGHGMVRVQGISMLPLLRPGQRLAVEFSPTRLATGDLLLFRQGRELVVHRLLGTGRDPRRGAYHRTRGDGVPRLDPPVAPDDVVGRVTALEGSEGWRDVRGPLARAYGRLVAWHDRFWSLVQHGAAARLDPWLERVHWRLRLQPRVVVLDRGLLRVAHRLLFRALHPPIAAPPGVDATVKSLPETRSAGSESAPSR